MDKSLGRPVESLPPSERAERYRQMAKDALRRATDTNDEQRSELVQLAAGWLIMAVKAEKSAGATAVAASLGEEPKADAQADQK